jgi:hypothetical protein
MQAVAEISARAGVGGSCSPDGNYLQSPNRIYFGVVQQDGKFVVHRGVSPQDKQDALWSTSVDDPAAVQGARQIMLTFMGNNARGYPVYIRVVAHKNDPDRNNALRFYDLWDSPEVYIGRTDAIKAVVEDDGNFCLYSLGEGQPSSAAKLLWASNVTDPVVEYDMSKITYDLTAAKILGSEPATVLTLEAKNTSSSEQTPQISGTYTLSRTSGWANALATKVGVKVSGSAGVPFVAKGKVELSTEVQNTYTWNGSKTETQAYTFSAPLKLRPHEHGTVVLTATNTHISVPYSGTGELLFKSGKRCSRRVEGMYEGQNGHSVQAEYTSGKMEARSLPLTVIRVPG